jgi:hypothetical protein
LNVALVSFLVAELAASSNTTISEVLRRMRCSHGSVGRGLAVYL